MMHVSEATKKVHIDRNSVVLYVLVNLIFMTIWNLQTVSQKLIQVSFVVTEKNFDTLAIFSL